MVVSTKLRTCEECQQLFVKILHFGQCSQACVGLLGCPVQAQSWTTLARDYSVALKIQGDIFALLKNSFVKAYFQLF